jgi:hypothetical protein
VARGEHLAAGVARLEVRGIEPGEGLGDLVVPLADALLRDDRPERLIDELGVVEGVAVRGGLAEELVVDPEVRDGLRDLR